eukprot:7072253-Heterocapsa_arctica.AAC.1
MHGWSGDPRHTRGGVAKPAGCRDTPSSTSAGRGWFHQQGGDREAAEEYFLDQRLGQGLRPVPDGDAA